MSREGFDILYSEIVVGGIVAQHLGHSLIDLNRRSNEQT